MVVHNKVFSIYGPNVTMKQTASPTHVTAVTPQGLAPVCTGDINARFRGKIKNGSIMMAAQNFSCNSNCEQAPRALKFSGVELVAAGSFTRILFRNATNIGLPTIEYADICGFCRMGGEFETDLSKGIIRNIAQGTETKGMVLLSSLLNIMTTGSSLNKLKAGMERKQDEGSENRTAQEDHIRSGR